MTTLELCDLRPVTSPLWALFYLWSEGLTWPVGRVAGTFVFSIYPWLFPGSHTSTTSYSSISCSLSWVWGSSEGAGRWCPPEQPLSSGRPTSVDMVSPQLHCPQIQQLQGPFCIRNWQTTSLQLNRTHHLLLWIQLYWKTVTPTSLHMIHIACDYSLASGCAVDCIPCKT